ncbi:peptidase [Brachybacterium phenoliresistens]|uniref:Peptidase n=1 Tax=Brachybacterium phenoliresistens TaxID=396014 RepID=Z9JVD1_9MICO|nr:M23 family metallopeptidase [Brachybacterium phenoliresistens]EWS82139.1 peptidase [Brachybacterium phenoliresistens]
MTTPVNLEYPFTQRWLAQNSPANRVPSHGTTVFATTYAIDFVPVSDTGRTALFGLGSLLRAEPPDRFTGFRRPILSPLDGVVVAVHDGEPDHHAYRGFSSLGYALTQRQRVAGGWAGLAGNHVFIEQGGVIVALCHLARGSIAVRLGQDIRTGDMLGECGNSGNSTEPHLHLQAITDARIDRARALPLTFGGELPRNRDIVDPPRRRHDRPGRPR